MKALTTSLSRTTAIQYFWRELGGQSRWRDAIEPLAMVVEVKGRSFRPTFRIEVIVQNRTWERLSGYKEHFQVEWRYVASGIPETLLPQRTERRE